MHRCEDCCKLFASKKTLYQHIRSQHKESVLFLPKFKCGHCCTEFISTSNLLRHLRNVYKLTGNLKCVCCTSIFGNQVTLDNHMSNSHSSKSGSNITGRSAFGEAAKTSGFKTALNSAFTIYRLEFESTVVKPFQYLVSNNKQILSFVNNKLPTNGSSRVGPTIHVRLLKPLEGETVIAYFHTKMELLGHELQDDDFNNFVDQLICFPDAVPSRGGERISQKQHRPKLWDVLRGRKNSKQIPFLGREWPGNSRTVHLLKQPEGVNCCPWCLRDIKKLKTWENEWWNNLLKECEEAMLRQDIGEMYCILKIGLERPSDS